MDYCTGWFEGWWSMCCKAHDADYAAGIARAIADLKLEQCVAASGYSPATALAATGISLAMYMAVRAFGWWFYPGQKRK